MRARTDHVAGGAREALFFLSVKHAEVKAGIQDRAFCARTTDGGRSFSFLGWMLPESSEVRSVMPSTVRLSGSTLVSALRRRLDITRPDGGKETECWIDAAESQDGGVTWRLLGKVADTQTAAGQHNGNPPSMIRLRDGRLCVVYGYRASAFGIRAKISGDEGRTWGGEILLRQDARTWDIGYPRSVVRPDGRVVSVYYTAAHN